jgi:hypothetical protein
MSGFYRGTGALGSVGGRLNPFNYDFGISEKIGGNVTPQGGSNLFGGSQAAAPQGGQVLGAQNTNNSIFDISDASALNNISGPTRPDNTQTPSLFNGGGGGTPPSPQLPPSPSGSEIDSIYNPIINQLNDTRGLLSQNLDAAIQGVGSQIDASRERLTNQRDQSTRTLGEQELQASQRKESAIADARRLYNELMQANQQRFGGTTSAGLAASELQGREFQQNQTQISQQFQETAREIDRQKLAVQEQYNTGLAQLEADRDNAISQLRMEFQDRMNQIDANRAQAESDKARERLQALMDLRNQVFNINQQFTSFQGQLDNQLAQVNQNLDGQLQQMFEAVNQGGNALAGFNQSVPLAASTAYGVTNPGMTNQGQQFTGAISDDDDENNGVLPPLTAFA